jgi:hypothetical protein
MKKTLSCLRLTAVLTTGRSKLPGALTHQSRSVLMYKAFVGLMSEAKEHTAYVGTMKIMRTMYLCGRTAQRVLWGQAGA